MSRFSFRPISPRGGSSAGGTSPIKWIAIGIVFLLGFGALAGWMAALRLNRPHDDAELSGPVILAMRQLGDLHTASYAMKDVFKQTTESEPPGLVKSIPGGESLVRWATHNEALIVADGNVEAGVDLRGISEQNVERVRGKDGSETLRVHLPPVTIYPANVKVRVEHADPGLFYRDDNIVPKAEATARQRFTDAAVKADLRGTARRNTLDVLTKLQHTLGKQVEFTF